MKKIVPLVFLIIALSSCQKLGEYYKSFNDYEVPDCQVTKIESYVVPSYTRTFTYHEDGRPDFVTSSYTNEDGIEFEDTYFYRYDEHKRLVSPGDATTANPTETTYAYEGDSRLPVRDTIDLIAFVFVEDLEYDAKGRIIRVYKRMIFNTAEGEVEHPDEEYRYYYDIRGNRQDHPSNPNYQGLIEYTDKPSIYSLNPVWQLQFKNYSRNSAVEAEAYNSSGLPLRTRSSEPRNRLQPFYDMGGSTLEYQCN